MSAPVQRLLILCLLVLAGLAVALLGLWLARRTRRSGRRGVDPHCFRCGYNLTGLPLLNENQLCPECGANLRAEKAIACGRPRLRTSTMLLGVLLIIAGGIIAAGSGRFIYLKTRWVQIRPASWVLEDARAVNGVRAIFARTELATRFNTGRLSAEDEDAFLEHLLDLQGDARLNTAREHYLECLLAAYVGGRLTPTQAERFLHNFFFFRLEVRPIVPDGGSLPIRLYVEQRPWDNSSVVNAEVVSLTCDGREMDVDLEALHVRPSWYGIKKSTVDAAAPGLGTHQIQATVHVVVSARRKQAGVKPLHESARELHARFEVVADKPANMIKMHADVNLGKDLSGSFKLRRAMALVPEDQPHDSSARLMVYVRGPRDVPMDAAFEVVAELDGGSIPLGDIVLRAGEPCQAAYELTGVLGDKVPDEVRVRFVASVDAALRTVDFQEIWDGELDLGVVPVLGAEHVREWLEEGRTDE